MAKSKDTTKILGLAAIAAAAFYFLRPKTASASVQPGDDSIVPDSTPPEDDSLPSPGQPKRNAPPMGMSKAEAISTGKIVITELSSQYNAALMGVQGWDTEMGPPPPATPEEASEVKAGLGVPSGRTTASWITDAAYFGLFGDGAKVPPAGSRGSGWSKYIEVWNALYSDARAKLTPGL